MLMGKARHCIRHVSLMKKIIQNRIEFWIKVFCSRLRERRVKWRPITWLTRVAHNVLIEHVELDLSGLANDVSTAGRNKSEDKELNCIEIRIRISLFFTSTQRSSINFDTKALFFHQANVTRPSLWFQRFSLRWWSKLPWWSFHHKFNWNSSATSI